MNGRIQQLKAGSRVGKADGESEMLAKIAAMPSPDRAMAERVHAVAKATGASSRRRRTWLREW
ncbi:MAG: hypothetical protein AB7V27_07105 [Candidatus Binatia bacterium]